MIHPDSYSQPFPFQVIIQTKKYKKQNKLKSLLIISGRTLPLSRLQCMGCNKLMAVKPGPQSCRQFLAKTTSGATSSKAPRSSSRPAPSSRFQTVILTAIYPRLGFSKIYCMCAMLCVTIFHPACNINCCQYLARKSRNTLCFFYQLPFIL